MRQCPLSFKHIRDLGPKKRAAETGTRKPKHPIPTPHGRDAVAPAQQAVTESIRRRDKILDVA
jgi:hypothetical protein